MNVKSNEKNNEVQKGFLNNLFYFTTLFFVVLFSMVVFYYVFPSCSLRSKRQIQYIEKNVDVQEKQLNKIQVTQYSKSNRDLIERFLDRQSDFLGHTLTIFGILITVTILFVGIFQFLYFQFIVGNFKERLEQNKKQTEIELEKHIKDVTTDIELKLKKDITDDISKFISKTITKTAGRKMRELTLLSGEAREILVPLYRKTGKDFLLILQDEINKVLNCFEIKENCREENIQVNLKKNVGILNDLILKQSLLVKLFSDDVDTIKEALEELKVHPFKDVYKRLKTLELRYEDNSEIVSLIAEVKRVIENYSQKGE